MKKIITFFRNVFVVIGILTVITVVSIVMLAVTISEKISKSGGFKDEVFENTLLTISTSAISGDVFAKTDYMVLNSFFTTQISLIDTLSTIQKAANDPKILGIFINMNSLKLNYAQTEELRKGLAEFGFGIKPFLPRILPSLPILPIIAGTVTSLSKSVHSSCMILSISSSLP